MCEHKNLLFEQIAGPQSQWRDDDTAQNAIFMRFGPDCKFRPIRIGVSVDGKLKVETDKNDVDLLGRRV